MTTEHDHEPPSCGVCGDRADLVRQMVEWVKPLGPLRFELIHRCRDRATCRARLEATGRRWPLVDSTPEPSRPAAPVVSGSR